MKHKSTINLGVFKHEVEWEDASALREQLERLANQDEKVALLSATVIALAEQAEKSVVMTKIATLLALGLTLGDAQSIAQGAHEDYLTAVLRLSVQRDHAILMAGADIDRAVADAATDFVDSRRRSGDE
ncbi:MAG: hypothetical protein F4Z19_11665 [Holophagales bacterium]|nr:hypothetical protein [Holophagales bacterium]